MACSEEAAKAINSLRLAEVHGKIQQQLEACGNNPVAAFHYRFLSENPEILSMKGGMGLNFNDHSEPCTRQRSHAGPPSWTLTKPSKSSAKLVRHGILPMEGTRATSPYSFAVPEIGAACYHPALEILSSLPQWYGCQTVKSCTGCRMLSAFAGAAWHKDWRRWWCERSPRITIHTGHTPRPMRVISW